MLHFFLSNSCKNWNELKCSTVTKKKKKKKKKQPIFLVPSHHIINISLVKDNGASHFYQEFSHPPPNSVSPLSASCVLIKARWKTCQKMFCSFHKAFLVQKGESYFTDRKRFHFKMMPIRHAQSGK